MVCADGNLIELLAARRYESQKKQVQGELDLTGPGMVLLLWNNSFSWVHTKHLAYHVELKQETLPVFDAEKTQLALKARLERERKMLQFEVDYNRQETQLQTELQTIEFMRHQIEELQAQLKQHEDARENLIKKQDQLKDDIEDLCWELQALCLRCVDQATRYRLFDFLNESDLTAWSLTNKKWYEYIHAYQATKA